MTAFVAALYHRELLVASRFDLANFRPRGASVGLSEFEEKVRREPHL